MHTLTHRLLLLARWPVIGALFAIVVLCNILIFPGLYRQMQQLSPGVLPPLDIHLSWSAAEGRAWVESLGPARRLALYTSLVADMIYPLVYGLLLVLLYLRYLPWALPKRWLWVSFLPVGVVWTDWLENLFIASMAWYGPRYPEWLGTVAASCTWLKWRLVIGLTALLLALIGIGLWRQLRRTPSS